MMKKVQILLIGIAGVLLVCSGGCSSDDTGMSAKDEANLKAHDASKIKMPTAEQMRPGAGFSSSIQATTGGAPAPAASPTGGK
ncbi:MAG TPA: hypothetical protein VG944_19145 [Fimbriimonas sp.]|nr:hypothetical protein [Fimbriimonas sp.]